MTPINFAASTEEAEQEGALGKGDYLSGRKVTTGSG